MYIYIISFFTSISRESSELLTAPLRLGAACMMATVECPRHLSAPLLLPEASQHVAHAYVWSSPGDNIKFPLFCPSFRASSPVIRPWMACIACKNRLWVLKGWTSGTLSPHPRLLDSPTTMAVQKGWTMSTSSKDERSCDCCFRWPAKTSGMCDFRVLQFETSRALHDFFCFLLWSFASWLVRYFSC